MLVGCVVRRCADAACRRAKPAAAVPYSVLPTGESLCVYLAQSERVAESRDVLSERIDGGVDMLGLQSLIHAH